MDGGPGHFKTFELSDYFFNLKKNNIFQNVDYNYFIEYHGKSICDSHFSHLSVIINNFENGVAAILSTNQLISVLNEGLDQHAQTNLRKKIGNGRKNTTIIKYERLNENTEKTEYFIKNFKPCYSFKVMEDCIEYRILLSDNTYFTQPFNQRKKKKNNSKTRIPSILPNCDLLSPISKSAKNRESFCSKHQNTTQIDLMDFDWETEIIETGSTQTSR